MTSLLHEKALFEEEKLREFTQIEGVLDADDLVVSYRCSLSLSGFKEWDLVASGVCERSPSSYR
jgi:hypothetical protein